MSTIDNTIENFNKLVDSFRGLITQTESSVASVSETLNTAATSLLDSWANDILPKFDETILLITDSFTNEILPRYDEAMLFITDSWTNDFLPRYDEAILFITDNWGNEVLPRYDEAANFIKEAWVNTIEPAITFVQEAFTNEILPRYDEAAAFIVEIWKDSIEPLALFIQNAWTVDVLPRVDDIISFVKTAWKVDILSRADKAFSFIENAWTETIEPLVQSIQTKIDNVMEEVVTPTIGEIKKSVVDILNALIDSLNPAIKNTVDTAVNTINKLLELVSFVAKGILIAICTLVGGVVGFMIGGPIGAAIGALAGGAISGLLSIFKETPKIEFDEDKYPQIPNISLNADGGIPGYGELFIAREAGPEFVGSFGSRNVVMNNNQIVDAVSGGVYDAVRRANAEQSQQPIYLNVEAKVRENVLFDMMEKVRAERGVRLSTGGAWYKRSIRNIPFHIATEMPKGGVRHIAGQLPWPPLAKNIVLFHSLHIT